MANSKVEIRFDGPEHHELELPDGQIINGGDTAKVAAEVAEELTTAPYLDVSVVDGEELVERTREEVLQDKGHDELVEIATTAGVFNPGLIADDDELVAAILEAEAPDEERAQRLVDNNSREELDTLARSVGVEDPESLDNKQAVAEAIVNREAEARS